MEVCGDAWALAGSLTFVCSSPSTNVAFAATLFFREASGRTDLPGGDPDQLFESVDRVLSLPGKTTIYPGHGSRTTVASEKAYNPFL